MYGEEDLGEEEVGLGLDVVSGIEMSGAGQRRGINACIGICIYIYNIHIHISACARRLFCDILLAVRGRKGIYMYVQFHRPLSQKLNLLPPPQESSLPRTTYIYTYIHTQRPPRSAAPNLTASSIQIPLCLTRVGIPSPLPLFAFPPFSFPPIRWIRARAAPCRAVCRAVHTYIYTYIPCCCAAQGCWFAR